MPLPFLLLAGAGLSGAKGLQKLAQGIGHLNDAKGIGERSVLLGQAAQRQAEQRDHLFGQRAQAFAEHRRQVQLTSLVRFAGLYERQVSRLKLTDKDFAARFQLPETELKALKNMAGFALNMASLAMQAGTAGVGVGQGAALLVGSYGLASTGTAIGTLSGAAASNATLAWLGGGSLAAGGGGMALGTVVLSGLAAAPALVITGYGVAKKGEQALSKALAYEAEVRRYRAKVRRRGALQDALERRMSELETVLEETRSRLETSIDRCEQEEQAGGPSDESFGEALLLAQSVSALLNVNVVEENARRLEGTEPPAAEDPGPETEAALAEEVPVDWAQEIDGALLLEDWIDSAVLDVDDSLVASTGGRLLFWDSAEEEPEFHDLGVRPGSVCALDLHPEQDLLVGARGSRAPLWVEGLREEDLEWEELDLGDLRIFLTQFLKTGEKDGLFVAARDGAFLFGVQSAEEFWAFRPVQKMVRAALHPQGTVLAFADDGHVIHVVDPQTGAQFWQAQHLGEVKDLRFSPDGRWLLSASEDKTARLWDSQTGDQLRQFEYGERYVDRVAFGNNGELLAVGFANGTVGLWTTQEGRLLNLFDSGKGRVHALQFGQDDDLLLVAGEGGLRVCWPSDAVSEA